MRCKKVRTKKTRGYRFLMLTLLVPYFMLVCIVYHLYPDKVFAASAQEIYEWYCTQCHGLSGMGNGINAKFLPVKPKDHTDKTDPKKYMRNLKEKEIFEVIKHGGAARDKSEQMPPWGETLSDGEIKGLVKHLRKLCCS